MSDRLYFSVPDECDNMLAQRFLRDKCGLSARIITRLKREKDGILMDGKILRTIDCVQSGKTVSIAIPDEKCEIEPTKGTLDIRYEDEHFLVVNKPHSMPVHPVKQHQSDTLANIVSYYCSQNGKPFVFRAINRLDKDTSGLVLIAKNRFTANAVKNKTHKVYYALCEVILALTASRHLKKKVRDKYPCNSFAEFQRNACRYCLSDSNKYLHPCICLPNPRERHCCELQGANRDCPCLNLQLPDSASYRDRFA